MQKTPPNPTPLPSLFTAMKTQTYVVRLSNADGDYVATVIEQPNEGLALLVASQAYPDLYIESIAQLLLY
jgi:hypothetical protein